MDAVKKLIGLPTVEDTLGSADGLSPEQVRINTFLRECQGRSFLTSLSIWPVLFGAMYFGQAHFGSKMGGYSRRGNLITSWLFSVTAAYLCWKSAHIDCEKTADQKRDAVARRLANPYVR